MMYPLAVLVSGISLLIWPFRVTWRLLTGICGYRKANCGIFRA